MAGILVEFVGSDGGAEFWQSGPIGVNVVVVCAMTAISIVVVVAH